MIRRLIAAIVVLAIAGSVACKGKRSPTSPDEPIEQFEPIPNEEVPLGIHGNMWVKFSEPTPPRGASLREYNCEDTKRPSSCFDMSVQGRFVGIDNPHVKARFEVWLDDETSPARSVWLVAGETATLRMAWIPARPYQKIKVKMYHDRGHSSYMGYDDPADEGETEFRLGYRP